MKYKMNLRLFDEGGAGAAGTGTGTTAGSGEGTASSNGGGGTAAGAEGERDFNAEFDEMIQGEYKDAYNRRMQQAMQEQRKGSRKTEDRLKAAEGLLALVGERYSLDGKDFDALQKALEGDRKYLEEEALEKGMTVEQLAEFKRMERENRAFQEQIQQARDRQEFEHKLAGWNAEAEQLKATYPELDLMQEFQNPNFIRMLDNGVDMQTAYQAVHFDELMGGALKYTAAQTEKKVMDGIKAKGARPNENGAKGSGAAREKIDVNKLTKEQRSALIEEAMRNPDKRITFN